MPYLLKSIVPTGDPDLAWLVTIDGGRRPVTYKTAGTEEQARERAERVIKRLQDSPEWAFTIGKSKDRY